MLQLKRVRPVFLVATKNDRPTDEPLQGYFEGARAAGRAVPPHDLQLAYPLAEPVHLPAQVLDPFCDA